jgi:hypothetical protein
MHNHIHFGRGTMSAGRVALMVPVFIFGLLANVQATNVVDLNPMTFRDTIFTGGINSTLDIFIENDFKPNGISLPLKIWSPDGAGWIWNNVGGYGPGGIGTGKACVTIVPGSRMDPPETVFDLTGLVVIEYDVDQEGTDVIRVGGASLNGGVPAGPYQHMYSYNFIATGDDGDASWVGTLCFDSISFPPTDDFVFQDGEGSYIVPLTAWPEGGLCYPVRSPVWCGPSFSGENSMTTDHCHTGSVTFQAIQAQGYPLNFYINDISGGNGTADLVRQGEDALELRYTPAPSDVGQAITVQVQGDCINDPPGWGDSWTVSITVTGAPPTIEGGLWYNAVGINNTFIKSDILGADVDTCDNLEYTLISGPGQIDIITGVYTLTPTIDDLGAQFVYISALDGSASAIDSFYLNVIDVESFPGNANCNDDVDVADAVFLINFVFKDGVEPPIANWADANADCTINIADVVYLVGYIFRSGPAPQPGCVN